MLYLKEARFCGWRGPGGNGEYSFILIKGSVVELLNLQKKNSSSQNSCLNEGCVYEAITHNPLEFKTKSYEV